MSETADSDALVATAFSNNVFIGVAISLGTFKVIHSSIVDVLVA